MKRIAAIFISSLFLSLSHAVIAEAFQDFGTHAQDAISTSMIQLIANPDKWNNKIVNVSGVLVLRFEGNALYLSLQDAKHNITKNAIWINIDYKKLGIPDKDPSNLEDFKKATQKALQLKLLEGTYVAVEGKFNSKSNGHMGLYSGTISVNRIYSLDSVMPVRWQP